MIITRYIYRLRDEYQAWQLKKTFKPSTSIISNNCFAGKIYQDLKYKYTSPTEGLFFYYPDYIVFLKNLRHYLTEAKLTFTRNSRYLIANERRKESGNMYPIGLLDGNIEIHFLHYHTEEEAAEKCLRRTSRVNFDDIWIIGSERDLCTDSDIRAFDELSFHNKVFFSSKDYPDLYTICFMKEFQRQGEVEQPYACPHIFYKYLINYCKKIKKKLGKLNP